MSRAPFTHDPAAWLYSKRDSRTPAEYAACLERPAPHDRRFARVTFVGIAVLLLAVLVPFLIERVTR